MRLFCLFLASLLISTSAHAQTPVTKESANTYYNSCVNQPPSMPFMGNGQQLMCACQAARMTQFFTMEDMRAMMAKDPAVARPAYNKMILHVYAPCMGEPTRAYHYNSCMSNPQITSLGNPEGLCLCAANALADYMMLNGTNLLAGVLARDPNVTDPNAALFNDPSFQTLAVKKTTECLK